MFSSTSIVVVLSAAALGADPASDAPANGEAAKRLAEMQEAAAAYELFRGNDKERPLDFSEKPILRYTDNITGVPDGSLFLWTKDERPEAVVCIWYHPNGARYHEFQSLSGTSLVARADSVDEWTPTVPGAEFHSLDQANKPAATDRQRLVQMRAIARQFSAAVSDVKYGRQELRLLPQPIYRYGKADSPVLDGALFAFAKGTNPEIMLLVEARDDGNSEVEWHYAPVRMSSRECEMKHMDKSVWQLPLTKRQQRTEPYFNRVFR